MTVTLPYSNEKDMKNAAIFINRLIETGTSLFNAVIKYDLMVITFTGAN